MAEIIIRRHYFSRLALWFLFFQTTLSQWTWPSNGTSDLGNINNTPRFLMGGSQISDLPAINLAPLYPYWEMSHTTFLNVRAEGRLIDVTAANANMLYNNQYALLSCDAEEYTGNLDASDVFEILMRAPRTGVVVLYSTRSDHCASQNLRGLPLVTTVMTTVDRSQASRLAALSLSYQTPGSVVILPDMASYTNQSSWVGTSTGASGTLGQPATTAIAMVILYAITGIITASFIIVIVAGAIRAHRHPERYRRSNMLGRGRPSRAKGLAQAILDTIPVIRFGDRQAEPKKGEDTDVELADHDHGDAKEVTPVKPIPIAASVDKTAATTTARDEVPTLPASQESGEPEACSICTDEFATGQEVRVLPCNHLYHPECVDPWLLNVSGTCPLCRINLDPTSEATTDLTAPGLVDDVPPPLTTPAITDNSASRRAYFRQIAMLSREDRIAYLRRWRQERRGSVISAPGQDEPTETERRGRTRRFRERFRIRTEQRGVIPEQSENPTTVSDTTPPTSTTPHSPTAVTQPAPAVLRSSGETHPETRPETQEQR